MALAEKWFKVRKDKAQLPNGKILDDYFVWESGDVVMVVPLTPQGKFILVKQYRHGVGETMIEYPAGYVDGKEKTLEAAKREMAEETGYQLENLELLAKTIHQPTKENGVVSIYLARTSDKKVEQVNPDESEDIEILERKPEEILEMIRRGEIWADGTISATFFAFDKLGLLQFTKK